MYCLKKCICDVVPGLKCSNKSSTVTRPPLSTNLPTAERSPWSSVCWCLTFCCGSALPPPGSCQGSGLWCWGTGCCWRGTSCPPPARTAACGTGRAWAGSSRRSPSLRRHAPSRVCCAASVGGKGIEGSRLMSRLSKAEPLFHWRAAVIPLMEAYGSSGRRECTAELALMAADQCLRRPWADWMSRGGSSLPENELFL